MTGLPRQESHASRSQISLAKHLFGNNMVGRSLLRPSGLKSALQPNRGVVLGQVTIQRRVQLVRDGPSELTVRLAASPTQ